MQVDEAAGACNRGLRVAAGYRVRRRFWAIPSSTLMDTALAPVTASSGRLRHGAVTLPRATYLCSVEQALPIVPGDASPVLRFCIRWKTLVGTAMVEGTTPEGACALGCASARPQCDQHGRKALAAAAQTCGAAAALRQLYEMLTQSRPGLLKFPSAVTTSAAASFWGLTLPMVQAWLTFLDRSTRPILLRGYA